MRSSSLNLTQDRGAIFSVCKTHRFLLWRFWDRALPTAMCIGVNPSSADDLKDDPTIRILRRILSQLNFGGLLMTNLYSFISSSRNIITDHAEMLRENDRYMIAANQCCETVIFCWGNLKGTESRANEIIKRFPKSKCFGKTLNQSPKHPRALSFSKELDTPILIDYPAMSESI